MPMHVPLEPDAIAAFESALRADGYLEILTRDIAALTQVPTHTHAFDVRALMLAGELDLSVGGQTQRYGAGDVFIVAGGVEHAEQFGSTAARYLVGRRALKS